MEAKAKATAKAVKAEVKAKAVSIVDVAKALEKGTGRKFTNVLDSASTYNVNDRGVGHSYLLSLGSQGNADTRFQVWVTQRTHKDVIKVRVDIYIGYTYSKDLKCDAIDFKSRKYEKIARDVSTESVIQFFRDNNLVLTATKKATSRKKDVKAV